MSRTLLLADGSVTIQRVMELTFAHEDIRVTTASDGRKAMKMLESESPDVVLADVDLPEVDGYALAAHIRRVPRLKHVPILLLAGAFDPVDQGRAREVGSDGVITKPFEPQVVVTRVKELIDQRDRQAAPAKPSSAPAAEASRPAPAAAPAPAPAPAAKAPRPEPAFTRIESPAPVAQAEPELPVIPEPLELPTRPIWDVRGSVVPPDGAGQMAQTAAPPLPALPHVAAAPAVAPLQPVAPVPAAPQPPAAPRVTLANAFTALLAAEQSVQPSAAAAPAISEASIEDAVRRVLVRMTDDLVRRIVVETAERLIREEIERIKANPE
jgi:CheY-like chemotaxis protein